MMDIISCFGEIAEKNGWKLTERDDNLYAIESTFDLPCIASYMFSVCDNGNPVTLIAFVDVVRLECENFDISKETYSRLNSDGHYKSDGSFGLQDVYLDIKRVYSKLNDLCRALDDRYAKIEEDVKFYNECHNDVKRCSHVLERVLDDERLSDGEIADMMYSLVRDVAKYAVSHNSGKINHTARELLGGTFSEKVLKCFDKVQTVCDDDSERSANGSKPLTKTVTELCPHCESEIEMVWSVDDRGYKAFCPVCGQRLMLCYECEHSGPDGEFVGKCDYCSETDSCQHNPPKENAEDTEGK